MERQTGRVAKATISLAYPSYGVSLGNRGHDMSKPSDLVQGTLDMLLLKILALGTDERLRHESAVKAGVRRRVASERRIAVPGSA